MELPPSLIEMDAKPGSLWTEEDFVSMMEWWARRGQERLVWSCAARYLGTGATRQDVEEAWVDFYKSILVQARKSYIPEGPGFCIYALNVCLKRHCIREGGRIRRRNALETALDATEIERSDSTPTGFRAEPQEEVQRKAFLTALANVMSAKGFPEKHRVSFELRHLDQLSYAEIAVKMGAPEGSIKGWVHRAAARIAGALRQEGWLE